MAGECDLELAPPIAGEDGLAPAAAAFGFAVPSTVPPSRSNTMSAPSLPTVPV